MKAILKANFKALEADLKNYRLMKKHIREKLDELERLDEFEIGLKGILGDNLGVKTYSTGNPTEHQAMRLIYAENKRKHLKLLLAGTIYGDMERKIRAIEQTLEEFDNSLEWKKAALVRDRYFERLLTPDGLALKYEISRKTVYNWSDDFIRALAGVLQIPV